MSTINAAIQQQTFESVRQRALINILYSSGWAKAGSTQALRTSGLTWQQFNCLRILRGQKGKPATIQLIGERMLDPQSNASRLVDKLYEKGYVKREACATDRRRVHVTLTPSGEGIVAEASESIRQYYHKLAVDMTDDEVQLLSELLDRFRSVATPGS